MWRIELGVGVGPFRLGASIAEVLHALKSRLPVRPFEISYDAVAPYKRDVVVDSAEDGFRSCLTLMCTINQMLQLFGPTFPGHYEAAEQSYILGYEGGCVKFPIPTEFHDLYQNGTDLPIEFPNGATPAATGLMVFVGGDYRFPGLPAPTKK
uniref:Uncharacterized protein n=1 Tax=Hyaloperonospora arabidopsidis (strain Emoy2) TaxID=559515 RepID=M4C459_HYAAE